MTPQQERPPSSLPWEIIYAIHTHLKDEGCFRDLRECLFVSRQFWSSSRLLLRHTVVIRTRPRFRRFLATLREDATHPPMGQIVKALELINIGLTNEELVELGALLPNIERLDFDIRAWQNLIPPANFFLTWPNLTDVGDISRPRVLKTLCETHGFRLTSLCISWQAVESINDLPTWVPGLRRLVIHNDDHKFRWALNPSFLNHLEHSCPLLESLSISSCRIQDIDHIDLDNHPRNQTLRDLTFAPHEISAKWVVYIAYRYPELRALNLFIPPSAPTIGDKNMQAALMEVAHRCPRLERFRYTNSWLMHNIGPKGLFFEYLVNAAGEDPPLRELQLANIQSFNDDDVFSLAITIGPNLTKLDLSFLWKMTSSGLMAALENCKNLRELTVGGKVLGQPEFEFMPEVVANACPKLRILTLKHLTIVMDTPSDTERMVDTSGDAERMAEGDEQDALRQADQDDRSTTVHPPSRLEELWLHSVRFPPTFPSFLALAERLHTLVMRDSGQVVELLDEDDSGDKSAPVEETDLVTCYASLARRLTLQQRTIAFRFPRRAIQNISVSCPFVEVVKGGSWRGPVDAMGEGEGERVLEHVRLTHVEHRVGLTVVEMERLGVATVDEGAEQAYAKEGRGTVEWNRGRGGVRKDT
ncbi:hypothetical protein BC938DRAFT_476405 [Jimgerdemannia flammicorona]|uniref:F-box domain-containing protein n=1 Tax=Jimgerdemannia flammicorona TaxID=994334 RepID=A0A433QZ36_9FUNG|nr:hypothetical protein BC938DRAFT_476405 [Jimgerdemannia flammicorona]